MKKQFNPGCMLNPVPAVMVTCQGKRNSQSKDDRQSQRNGDAPNIITIAWTGIINTQPPMTYVSVRKSRHSHKLISESGEFTINLVTEKLVRAADWCGVKSGRDFDKFREMNLTPEPGQEVSCPSIAESPASLECRVREIHEYGTHDMFVAEIVNVLVDEKLIDGKGRICFDKAGLVSFSHGEYFAMKREPLGSFGYSVMKEKTRKRREKERKAANRIKAINKQGEKKALHNRDEKKAIRKQKEKKSFRKRDEKKSIRKQDEKKVKKGKKK